MAEDHHLKKFNEIALLLGLHSLGQSWEVQVAKLSQLSLNTKFSVLLNFLEVFELVLVELCHSSEDGSLVEEIEFGVSFSLFNNLRDCFGLASLLRLDHIFHGYFFLVLFVSICR